MNYSRVFIAIRFSEQATKKLHTEVQHLCKQDGIRLVAWQNYHLTLLFIGDLTTDQLQSAVQGLKLLADLNPLPLIVTNIGPFPRRNSPLLAALLDRSPPLLALRERILSNLAALSVPYPNEKRFRPHITVARAKSKGRKTFASKAFDIEMQCTRLGIYNGIDTADGHQYQEFAGISFT